MLSFGKQTQGCFSDMKTKNMRLLTFFAVSTAHHTMLAEFLLHYYPYYFFYHHYFFCFRLPAALPNVL